MRKSQASIVATMVLLVATGTYAAEEAAPSSTQTIAPVDKPLDAIEDGIKAEAGGKQTVEQCWAKWLSDQNLQEGKNDKNNHLVLVSRNTEALNVTPDSGKWVSARKAAFQKSEIYARAALAGSMKTLIQSDRSLVAQQLGLNDAPPSLRRVSEALSIADKVNVLADKALDSEIEKYDPEWKKKTKGNTLEERRQSAVISQEHVTSNVAASSQMFAAGAFTAVECEGPSSDAGGEYAILTGLIWSPKLASIAESIWNPAYKPAAEAPGGTLKEQFDGFAAGNPDWMAYTMGARVFTNEKGEHVVVGFGVVPQTPMMSLDKRRAGLDAFAAIQRFVGEKTVAGQRAGDSYQVRAHADGSTEGNDDGKYDDEIRLVSKELSLRGATEVLSWRGEHPWSQSKMQVVAFAWSPSWAADSVKTSEMMRSVEQRMSDQGAVPQGTTRTKNHTYHGAGAAVPARAGAVSSSRDF